MRKGRTRRKKGNVAASCRSVAPTLQRETWRERGHHRSGRPDSGGRWRRGAEAADRPTSGLPCVRRVRVRAAAAGALDPLLPGLIPVGRNSVTGFNMELVASAERVQRRQSGFNGTSAAYGASPAGAASWGSSPAMDFVASLNLQNPPNSGLAATGKAQRRR